MNETEKTQQTIAILQRLHADQVTALNADIVRTEIALIEQTEQNGHLLREIQRLNEEVETLKPPKKRGRRKVVNGDAATREDRAS